MGSVDGFGSVIVNGVRFGVDRAQVVTEGASSLQLGMTVLVQGTIDAGLATGTASYVLSVPELRGPVGSVNAAAGLLDVMGVQVSVDDATVYSGISGLSALQAGQNVQVYALPAVSGPMRATRIEKLVAAPQPVLWGTVQALDTAARQFRVGSMQVKYDKASFVGGLSASALANGMALYVNAVGAPVGNVLTAGQLRPRHALSPQAASPVALTGLVGDFVSLQSFTLQGTRVNVANARVTGGQASSIGNRVKLEVAGRMVNGVLVAERAKIRHIPGTGGPASFEVIGAVAQYKSLSSFRVNGQPVDASGSGVVFSNGTTADLRNGAQVSVRGSQVVDGVLIATQVDFTAKK
ncbi:MAG: hypothetical protein J7556_20415 [Acidovorax sp.]|nr:hypothetical protein [Acidovorax sp.]